MNSKIGTRPLVEAGLLVAITVVLSFFVLFVPLIGAIGYFTLPVPIAILYIRHDFKLSFIASIVSAIVIGHFRFSKCFEFLYFISNYRINLRL